MRRILPVVFGCVLLAVPTFAQRGGHGGAGGGHAGGGGMRGGGSSGFHAGSSGGAYRGSAAYRGAGGYRGGVGRSGGFRVNNGYRGGYGFRGYGYYGWPYYPGLYAGYYETVLEINGQEIYVEMRFDQRKPDWPKILIVHLHPPGGHFPIPKDST